MNITEYVKACLESATPERLKDIVSNGIDLPERGVLQALEREYYD
jgi:hypothetical protein